MFKFVAFSSFALFALTAPSRANLLLDGDFSIAPGVTSGTATDQGSGSYEYVHTSGTTTTNGGTVTGLGGAGGWTLQNGGAVGGSTPQDNSAIYVDNTASNPNGWIPTASATNANHYVIQLDTISTLATWTTGNAIYQTVNGLTVGGLYTLTFDINSETGTGKGNISAADVIVTNSTAASTLGSAGAVLTSSTTNKNAATYGNVTGYQYRVDTSALSGGATASTWVTDTYTFLATSTSAQIALADDPMSTNSNIVLENIILTPVPEPREWGMMMLCGAFALVAIRKYRARSLRELPAAS